MRPSRVSGLVSAGGISQSFLTRMPALLGALGPVKASSFRVAQRIAKTLRSGYAVKDYASLEDCHLIWMAVPDAMLDGAASELLIRTRLSRAMVVVCGSAYDSGRLLPLSRAGARVGSLSAVEGTGERLFVAEGHPDVRRELRRLAKAEKRNLVEMPAGSKLLYLAGVDLAGSLAVPWVAASVDSLCAAGFSRPQATRAVEALTARSLRSYGRTGRKEWRSASVGQFRIRQLELETLGGGPPHLARLYAQAVERAAERLEVHRMAAVRG